jgi:D-glycero-D-manno-heptose 1,7-bisphosphate phosphatase
MADTIQQTVALPEILWRTPDVVARLIVMLGARPMSLPGQHGAIRWVFLDRDGTLNVKPPDGEYVERSDALVLVPGAAAAVRTLNQAGIWTGVVTNQRGVALGRMSTGDLDGVHECLRHLLRLGGAFVDAIYVCPHDIGVCACRKPQTGLLLRAQSECPALDFACAAIVGDSLSDVQTGQRLGLRTVLISQGEADARAADHVVPNLSEAVRQLTAEPFQGTLT